MRSLHTHCRLSHIHILCDTLAGMVATTLVAVVVAGAVAAPSRSLFRRSWGCLMARCAGCRTSAGSSSGQQVAHVRAFSAEKSVTMRASLSRVRAARQAAAGVRMVLVRRLCVRLAVLRGRLHRWKGAMRLQGGCYRPSWARSMRTSPDACAGVQESLCGRFCEQRCVVTAS